jgi:TonB-dependent receptor
MEIATDNVTSNGDSRAVPGTSFTFDSSDVFDSGYITGPNGWRDDQWSGDPRTPAFGLQSNNILRDVEQQYVTDDLSLNVKWYVTDDWAMNFDYQHVKSTVDNVDAGIWNSTFQDLLIDLNGTSLPDVRFTPPQPCQGGPNNTCSSYFTGDHQSFTDPFNSFYRAAMDHVEESEGTSDAFRVDASRVFENSDWLDSIQFGYRYADRDQTARFSTYNWGSLSEIWGNGGPVWLDDPVPSNGGQPMGQQAAFYFDNFFNGKTGNPIGDDPRLFYDGRPAHDYDSYAEYAAEIAGYWGGSWLALAQRPNAIDGSPFLASEINPVREKNNAAYISMNWEHAMDNSMTFKGNVGVRYTDTERTAGGYEVFQYQVFPSEAECNEPLPPGQERSSWCALDPTVRDEARAYSDGTATPTDYKLNYNYWLPSVNLLLQAQNGLQFRGSYFKGVAAPDFGLTRAFFPIDLEYQTQDIIAGGGRPIGRFDAGNPDLLPVESHNFDLTAEWYFADVGQLTFALFYKELKNIRTNDVQRRSFTNNGATFEGIVTTAVNSKDTGKIKGVEVAYQQQFHFGDGWLSGFGINANYTYADSSNVPQSTLSETDPDVAAGNQSTVDIGLLPLEGLSEHTVNLQPFYEYEKWSARIAYSWRSEFLLTVRDVIVPFQPVMNESTGQLDASLFYQINDNLSIGFQGSNLTQEVIQTTAVINDDLLQAPRSWFLSDSRYSLVFRGRF